MLNHHHYPSQESASAGDTLQMLGDLEGQSCWAGAHVVRWCPLGVAAAEWLVVKIASYPGSQLLIQFIGSWKCE